MKELPEEKIAPLMFSGGPVPIINLIDHEITASIIKLETQAGTQCYKGILLNHHLYRKCTMEQIRWILNDRTTKIFVHAGKKN